MNTTRSKCARKPTPKRRSQPKRTFSKKVTQIGAQRPDYYSKTKRVLIIGGGISGYSLCHTIQQALRKRGHRDVELTLVDSNKKPGGWIHTTRAPFISEQGPRSLLLRPSNKGATPDDRVRWLLNSAQLTPLIIKPSRLADTKFLFRDGQFKSVNDLKEGKNSVIWRNIFSLAHYALGKRSSRITDLPALIDPSAAQESQGDYTTLRGIRTYDVTVIQHGDQFTRNLQRDAVVYGYRVDTDGQSMESFFHEEVHLLEDKNVALMRKKLDLSLPIPTISPSSTIPQSKDRVAARSLSPSQIARIKTLLSTFLANSAVNASKWIHNKAHARHSMLYNLFKAKQLNAFKFIVEQFKNKEENAMRSQLFNTPAPTSFLKPSPSVNPPAAQSASLEPAPEPVSTPVIDLEVAPLQLVDQFQAPHQHIFQFSTDNSMGLFHQLPHIANKYQQLTEPEEQLNNAELSPPTNTPTIKCKEDFYLTELIRNVNNTYGPTAAQRKQLLSQIELPTGIDAGDIEIEPIRGDFTGTAFAPKAQEDALAEVPDRFAFPTLKSHLLYGYQHHDHLLSTDHSGFVFDVPQRDHLEFLSSNYNIMQEVKDKFEILKALAKEHKTIDLYTVPTDEKLNKQLDDAWFETFAMKKKQPFVLFPNTTPAAAVNRVLVRNTQVLDQFGVPDETVGQFFTREIGPDALQQLFDPIIAGIYGGNPHTVSFSAAFPDMMVKEVSKSRFAPYLTVSSKKLLGGFLNNLFINRSYAKAENAKYSLSTHEELHPYYGRSLSPLMQLSADKGLLEKRQFRKDFKTLTFVDGMNTLVSELHQSVTNPHQRKFLRDGSVRLVESGPDVSTAISLDQTGQITTQVLSSTKVLYMRPTRPPSSENARHYGTVSVGLVHHEGDNATPKDDTLVDQRSYDYVFTCVDPYKLAEIMDHPLSHISNKFFDKYTILGDQSSPGKDLPHALPEQYTAKNFISFHQRSGSSRIHLRHLNTALCTWIDQDHEDNYDDLSPDQLSPSPTPLTSLSPHFKYSRLASIDHALPVQHFRVRSPIQDTEIALQTQTSQIDPEAIRSFSLNFHAQKHLSLLHGVNTVIYKSILKYRNLKQTPQSITELITHDDSPENHPIINSLLNYHSYHMKFPTDQINHSQSQLAKHPITPPQTTESRTETFPSAPTASLNNNKIELCRCGYFSNELPLDLGVSESFCTTTHAIPLATSPVLGSAKHQPSPQHSNFPAQQFTPFNRGLIYPRFISTESELCDLKEHQALISKLHLPPTHRSTHLLKVAQDVLNLTFEAHQSSLEFQSIVDITTFTPTLPPFTDINDIFIPDPTLSPQDQLKEQREYAETRSNRNTAALEPSKLQNDTKYYIPLVLKLLPHVLHNRYLAEHQHQDYLQCISHHFSKTTPSQPKTSQPDSSQQTSPALHPTKSSTNPTLAKVEFLTHFLTSTLQKSQSTIDALQVENAQARSHLEQITTVIKDWGNVPVVRTINNVVQIDKSTQLITGEDFSTQDSTISTLLLNLVPHLQSYIGQLDTAISKTNSTIQTSQQLQRLLEHYHTQCDTQSTPDPSIISQLSDIELSLNHINTTMQGQDIVKQFRSPIKLPLDELHVKKNSFVGQPTVSAISTALRSYELASMTLFNVVFADKEYKLPNGFGVLIPTYAHMQDFFDQYTQPQSAPNSHLPPAPTPDQPLKGLLGVTFDSCCFPELYSTNVLDFKSATHRQAHELIYGKYRRTFAGGSLRSHLLKKHAATQTVTFMAGGARYPEFTNNSFIEDILSLHLWSTKLHAADKAGKLTSPPCPIHIRINKQRDCIPQPLLGSYAMGTAVQHDMNFHFGYHLRNPDGEHSTVWGDPNIASTISSTSFTNNSTSDIYTGQGFIWPAVTVSGTTTNNPSLKFLMANGVNLGLQFSRHIDF